MPYIGNIPATQFTALTYQDLTGESGTSFTLDTSVGSAQDIEVFVNNVRQEPGVAYTISGGTTLNMTGTVSATDDFYVVFQGKAVGTITHPSDSALQATTGTFSGDLTVDTDTLHVDSTNDRVGIGTTSPQKTFVVSNAGAAGLEIAPETRSATVGTSLLSFNRSGSAYVRADYDASEHLMFISGSEKARINSSGNVGIGNDSPETILHATASSAIIRLTSDTSGTSGVDFGDSDDTNIGRLLYDNSDNSMRFTTNTSEQMRIDSNGTLIINDTGRVLGCPMHLTYDGANEQGICIENIANSTSGAAIRFIDSGGTFNSGGIYFATSNNVLYSTTSDYRLKENVTATWDATTRLKQLNPVRFNFISDAATTVDGFLAHEVQTVVPEAIIGTHNAVETWTQRQIDNGEAPDGTSVGDNKLDEDGNTVPMYQGIDQSKLVPLLVKTIQELEARITALETA